MTTKVHGKMLSAPRLNVADRGAVSDWDGTTGTDIGALINAALADLASTGGDIIVPPGSYHLSTDVVVDGNSDATNASKVMRILAHGARFYYTGAAKAFQFKDTDYCGIEGGQIFLKNDTSAVHGISLSHARWCRFRDVEVFNGLEHVGPAYASSNVAFYMKGGPSDTYDNLYNDFENCRSRRTGYDFWLETEDTEATATRCNANTVRNHRYGSKNGIYIKACEGNEFGGSLEVGVGPAVSLKSNTAGLLARFNRFAFTWVESSAYSNWTPDVDANCDNNEFEITNLEYGAFNIPGRQTIKVAGNAGTSGGGQLQIRNEQADLAELSGGPGGYNRLMSSEAFDTAQWTKSNCTATADSVAAPDGATTADTLTLTAANGYVSQTVTVASADTTSQPWTGSVWLRATTPHVARIQITTDNFATNANSATAYVYVTGEWKRYSLTKVMAGGTTGGLLIRVADADVATGELYAWGAQLNKGYLGAYMPTGNNATVRDMGNVSIVSRGVTIARGIYINWRADNDTFMNNARFMGYAMAAPTTGTWQQGDYLKNAAAAVGSPKGWYCTASGTPGTWTSEGNL